MLLEFWLWAHKNYNNELSLYFGISMALYAGLSILWKFFLTWKGDRVFIWDVHTGHSSNALHCWMFNFLVWFDSKFGSSSYFICKILHWLGTFYTARATFLMLIIPGERGGCWLIQKAICIPKIFPYLDSSRIETQFREMQTHFQGNLENKRQF